MSNEKVIKSVAKKLKYYFDVKRLEEGFDLSGAQNPVLDHPPLKTRPTLQYSGLHDRPLKHYYSSHDVRVNLTQMRSRPNSAAPHEKHVNRKLRRYMANYSFQLPGPDLPPVPEHEKRRKSPKKSKNSSQHSLPDYFYIYSESARSLRPEATGSGVPFKSPKKKPLKGGWPILRTVPSNTVSRGEAVRMVNAATKLLVATESVERTDRSHSNRQAAPRPFETPVTGFPGIEEEEAYLLAKARQAQSKPGQRPATAKYTYDINGRKVLQPPPRSYDDSFLGRSSRPYSSHPSSRPTSKRVVRQRSPRRSTSPSDNLSVSNQSFITQTSSADERNMERLPPSSLTSKSSGSRKSKRAKEKGDRPGSAKVRTRTIINVPELKVNEDVSVQDTTQTNGVQDEVGIQTETRLIREYDQMEDEVKQGPWSEYQIYVRTGNVIGASTKADVKIILYGENGRTKELYLGNSQKNKVAFQKGKEDLFILAAHHVGHLKKIKIGHDRTELSNAWFLDSVTVTDMHGKRIYEFPCRQWLSEHDGDKRTYRVLPADRDRAFVDALESPSASGRKTSGRRDSSENDESDKIVVKHDNESTRARHGQSNQNKHAVADDDYSSSDFESSTDDDEAGVVDTRDKRDAKSKSKSSPDEKRTWSGPTFTFRSKHPRKPDTKRYTEEIAVDDEEKTKRTQEEFLEGYKAGITAASMGNSKQAEEEKEKERQLLRGETIHEAARKGHLERVKELLQHFPDMKDSKDESGWTPLHHAAACGEIDMVKWLTTSGVDMNIETRTGYTPMHVAALNGHVNAMIVLSAMGAALTCRTVDQQTPLHLASRGGYLECVKWLVANRARIDTEDSFKRTPIDMAEEYQRHSVLDFLKACQRELRNPNSSFAQMQGRKPGDGKANTAQENGWRDDEGSSTSNSAEVGSDEESSHKEKRVKTPQIKEKKRLYEEQHHKMEETGMSFLDSIRQEVDT